MHPTSTAGTFAVLVLQNPRPGDHSPGLAPQVAAWIAVALVVLVMFAVVLWLLSRFARLIYLAERDDPHDSVYIEEPDGLFIEIPLGPKKPGQIGHRPDPDADRPSSRS